VGKRKNAKNKNPKPNGGPSFMDSDPANTDRKKTSYPNEQSKPRWFRWLEGAALAAGILYAVVTYLMWQDSHKSFRIDERAWLSVATNIPANVNQGTKLSGSLIVQNTGKTPARKIVFECTLSVQRNSEVVPLDSPGMHSISDMGMLTPNSNSPMPCFQGSFEEPVVLTSAQADNLLNGRAYLAEYGRGRFVDIFGGDHWVHFCIWHAYYNGIGNYNAQSCTDFNDTGDGSPPAIQAAAPK
jgi:hypothetical protein